jgi:hypothetical protein
MERTVWIFPFNRSPEEYKNFFEASDCGIVTDIRIRKGMPYPTKTMQNLYGFVEFAHPDSVKRALAKAAKKETRINSAFFKVYKAGTGTFIFTKKSKRQIDKEVFFKAGQQVPAAKQAKGTK